MSDICIKILPASYGDSILLLFKTTTFLIDGGTRYTFKKDISKILKEYFTSNTNNFIVLTHIDSDHIGGIKYLFENDIYNITNKIKAVIFNTSDFYKELNPNAIGNPPSMLFNDDNKTSFIEGKKFEAILKQKNIQIIDKIKSLSTLTIDGINITFLSPSQETISKYKTWLEKQDISPTSYMCDYSIPITELISCQFDEDSSVTNASSLSMLVEYQGKKILLLGDSIPSDVVSSLYSLGYSKEHKLKVDIIKLSHHGSKKNTSHKLLELLECNKYIISTDGKKHGHPNKETLAKIIHTQNSPEFLFNYEIFENIFTAKDKDEYQFKTTLCREVKI